jgi:hypothetical protein
LIRSGAGLAGGGEVGRAESRDPGVIPAGYTEFHGDETSRGRGKATDTGPGHRGHGIPLMEEMIDSVVIQHDGDGTRVLMRHPINW